MATEVNGYISQYTAGADLAAHVRVKLNSSMQWVVAGATDTNWIGTTTREFKSGQVATVRPKTDLGVHKMVGGSALTKGNTAYGAASGKVNATTTGITVGVVADTISADDDWVGIIPLFA